MAPDSFQTDFRNSSEGPEFSGRLPAAIGIAFLDSHQDMGADANNVSLAEIDQNPTFISPCSETPILPIIQASSVVTFSEGLSLDPHHQI